MGPVVNSDCKHFHGLYPCAPLYTLALELKNVNIYILSLQGTDKPSGALQTHELIWIQMLAVSGSASKIIEQEIKTTKKVVSVTFVVSITLRFTLNKEMMGRRKVQTGKSSLIIGNLCIEWSKYQEVKEFRMLACIGC